ncbi:TVP38/TMEM64 family protein [Loigolactobacillus iwatensis]|uniref:TVP38/TMEM64 family protein n=1 Tax=Loigolactobacillus iwatensis TaxID=1267156 RepID=UPI001CDD3B4A|nr:TVP38/TMEM64 family protein [Loigolactobacillus iwatensis]
MMTRLRILYNGVVIGILCALLAWQSTWLQMRISLGWLIPVVTVLVYCCYLFYGKHLQQNWAIFRFSETLIISAVSFLLLLAIYQWHPLSVVLGETVRELFNADWSLSVTAGSVFVLLIIWLLVLVLDSYRHPVPKLNQGDQITKLTLQSKISLGVTIGFIILLIAGYYFIPGYRHFIDTVSVMLAKLDIKALRNYIAGFGIWGPLISTFLMVFQSILAPLPAFVLTFANAYLYGWLFGAALSWFSAMLGALLCFYIARGIGRPFAEKIVTKKALAKMDGFFNEYGDYTIIVLRLLPFVSFDEVSYGAGFTDMKVGKFLIATGIGQLPATIVYSFVGGSLGGSKLMLFMALIAVILLVVVSLFVRKILQKRQAKKKTGVPNDQV